MAVKKAKNLKTKKEIKKKAQGPESLATINQLKKMYALLKDLEIDKAYFRDNLFKKLEITSTKQLKRSKLDEILAVLEERLANKKTTKKFKGAGVMNSITLIGNVTKDPELRFTPNGKATVSFSVAVTQYKNRNSDEWVSDFFNCVAWEKLAENIAESITKGTRVIIFGKLYMEKWEDKNGAKKQSVKIRVDSLGVELTYATCKVTRNAKQAQESYEDNFTDDDIPV